MPLSPQLASPTFCDRLNGRSGPRSAFRSIRIRVELYLPTCEAKPAREDPASSSDEDLLSRYRDARRPEDFAELFRRHSSALGRFLTRYLGDAALVEDVLQDTFFQIHAKCGLYRDGWAARPWLYAIAIHRAIDALRRSARRPVVHLESPYHADDAGSFVELLASAEPGPLDELQRQERQRWLCESVARLPYLQREVLVLNYFHGLTYAEIVGLLGISLGTVKSRLHGALERLRKMANQAGTP
jgi:RNA polymerase sigma-70 factor (ECF subfamily)